MNSAETPFPVLSALVFFFILVFKENMSHLCSMILFSTFISQIFNLIIQIINCFNCNLFNQIN